MLWVALHFHVPPSETLEPLAAWLCRFTPRVSLEPPQALGALPEPRAFFAPPARFAATLELPGEVAHAEGLLFAARRLLIQLEGLLTARQAGVRRFTLTLIHPKRNYKKRFIEKELTAVEINLASPTRTAERLARLLRHQLAKLSLGQPAGALRLEPPAFTPLQEHTTALFD